MENFFDRLGGVTVFSKIDLKTSYWQVQIAEGDECKTTSVTRYGLYDLLPNTGRTPGALVEGPIPIAGEGIICEAIQVLLGSKKKIDSLEHVIEEGRIKMNHQKIHAITDWLPPKDIHALRAFLGTNNTVVSHFMTQPKLNGRQARWQKLLAEFHFNLEYQSGKTNHVADALSRRADLASVC
ncbi:PREDICTED: uncharacterized protein LOC109241161 [Nicotiana attenuata]|uniref:uncharacterized protein LOC109241161 n=1 Tax=Nicotiana attenuata TaxID=49451 RepID=UPI000904E686|nr:PREDICTED: uncharacterized protein LOC109241161 [Nicotiana attenuata]